MHKPRSVVPVTIAAAALATTVTACGSAVGLLHGLSKATHTSSPSPSHSATNPLHGLSNFQISTKALADTKAAPSVKVSGHVQSSGHTITLDMTMVKGKGCFGTMAESQIGSFQLVSGDKTVWLKPDKKFWQTQGGSDPAALSLLEGKYIKVKASDPSLGSFAAMCSVSALLSGSGSSGSSFGNDGSFGNGGSGSGGSDTVMMTTYQGQRAAKITDTGDAGYGYVTDTAKPLLLNFTMPGSSGGTINFSYPAKPPAITPPPASEVIDGSKYGF